MVRIKSKTNCYTIDPKKKWSSGEVYEVEEVVAEKLLNNINFVRESSTYKTREMRVDKVSKK